MSMITIRKLPGYINWLAEQTVKFQAQVEKRLLAIENHAHFGTVKELGNDLAELKFNNGCRVYFTQTGVIEITLLLGGNKNGQSKDIKKARSLLA